MNSTSLSDFEAGSWRQRFPTAAQSWAQIPPFFAFSTEVRRLIYTPNAIESLNSVVRKVIRN